MDDPIHAGLKGAAPRAKATEFCQAVLDGRQFCGANEKLERFLADTAAKDTYIWFSKRRTEIQERQQRGFELTAGEIAELEKMQREIAGNVVIREFIDASEELERIKMGMVAYLEKAFELCRPPTDKDFSDEEKLLAKEERQRSKAAKKR